MTRDQIIHNLFTGKNFTDCIGLMEPAHLREDLRQEVILVVCEMPEEKIKGLHDRKELEFYTARIILNHIKSNTHSFYKKFRRQMEELTSNEVAQDEPETGDRMLKELIEDMALSEIELMRTQQEHWYAFELIQLYLQHQNYRALEKETRIPYISCYKTIKKALEAIRARVVNSPELEKMRIDYIKNYLNAV